MLVTMRINSNFYSLLVGMQNNTAILAFPYKTKHSLTI